MIDLTAKGILAVLVTIIGTGLLIGSVWGRARWLIFPGVFLTGALLLASWAPAFVGGSYGQVVWQPQSRKALEPVYEHGAGQAVLDLTEVAFDTRARTVEADVNFGELLVVVPKNVPVDATARVQGGQITNFGRHIEGWSVKNLVSQNGSGDKDLGRLTIKANVVFGNIVIRRVRDGDNFKAGSNDSNFNFGARWLPSRERIGGNQ